MRGRLARGGYLSLGVLFIVDDTTLLADTPEALQAGLALLFAQFHRYGLVVSVSKTVAVHFGGVDAQPCEVCGRPDGERALTLLCEGCDRAWHARCFGLETVAQVGRLEMRGVRRRGGSRGAGCSLRSAVGGVPAAVGGGGARRVGL